MREEVINGQIRMIGNGEDTVLDILKIFFSTAEFERQVPLIHLIGLPEYGSRQEKETIDIVMTRGTKLYAIRIQNEKGTLKSSHERRQRVELEEKNIKVIDVNVWECTEVFRENLNYVSIWEVANALSMAGVEP